MQRGRVLNLSRLKFTAYLKENKILIISLAVFLIGLILGITFLKKYDVINDFTKKYILEYIEIRNNDGFLKIFLNSFFTYILVLLVFLIFGTSILGVVTVPIILGFCGMFFGNITSFLYSEYALKGIAFNAVIFIPSTIIFAVLLLFACRESVNFSLKISNITITNSVSYNLSNQFKKFLIMFLLFTGICIISALVDAVISSSFIKFFQF